MSRVGIAHHHSAITVGGAHPTATFLWAFVSQRLMTVHLKIPFLPIPTLSLPLKGRVFLLQSSTHCSLLIAHCFFNSLLLQLIAFIPNTCFAFATSSLICRTSSSLLSNLFSSLIILTNCTVRCSWYSCSLKSKRYTSM